MHHRITLTRHFEQAFAIEYADLAACQRNQTLPFENIRNHGYGCAPRAEHVGDEFMRHRNRILLQTIVYEEDPARETFFCFMQRVAGRSLCDEIQKPIREPEEKRFGLRALRTKREKIGARNAVCLAGCLNECLMLNSVTAKHGTDSNHAFETYDYDLHATAGSHERDDGDDAASREVHELQWVARFTEDLAHR